MGSPSISAPPPCPPPPHTTIRHTMCHLLCGGISPHFPHISTIWGFSAIHPLLFIFIFIKIKIKRGRKWGGGEGWGGGVKRKRPPRGGESDCFKISIMFDSFRFTCPFPPPPTQ